MKVSQARREWRMGGERLVKPEVFLSYPPSGTSLNTDRLLMTLVERMRLEFNEMSRSSAESLAEITAADEYGAAVIKATESNLTKKRRFSVRFSPSRHPSPLQSDTTLH